MAAETFVLLTMVGGLTLYAVLGGADFGAGVWEFNTALRAPEEQRQLIYTAIGPVWETNHVWLIFVLVGLWSGFPPAYAGLSQALFVPLLLALGGIVFRGVGYAFRLYAAELVEHARIWQAVFAVASTAAPFFLGVVAGAVAAGLPVDAAGRFTGSFATGWISPTAVFGGFFTVGVCAYVAAVFMTREAHLHLPSAETVWRRRALLTGLVMGGLAALGIAVVAVDAPVLWDGFRQRAWPLVAVSAVAGLWSLVAMVRQRYLAAGIAAAGAVAAVVWGWAAAQYPFLVPPELTIEAARGPEAVLRVMVWGIVGGGLLLVPALWYLFALFKGRPPQAPVPADRAAP